MTRLDPMDAKPSDDHGSKETMQSSLQTSSTSTGPFALRTLLDNVPLTTEGVPEDVKITCVDYLGVFAPLSKDIHRIR